MLDRTGPIYAEAPHHDAALPFGSADPVRTARRNCEVVVQIPVARLGRGAATTTDFRTASVGLQEHLHGDSELFLHNPQRRL